MNNAKLRNKAEEIIRGMSDQRLLDALIDILGRPKKPEHNSVRIWLIDEVESRFPDYEQTMQEFFEANENANYDDRLVKFVKEKVNA